MEWSFVSVAILAIIAIYWLSQRKERHTSDTSSEGDGKFATTGFSVWVFERGSWRKIGDHSKPGHVARPAPTGAADFEGCTLRLPSVPRSGAS
jgi:hypothetical protein